MNNTNQCPKCKTFIFGLYCWICKVDIRDIENDFIKMFKDIMEDNEK